MKNYKKFIGILLASVLAFGVVGCGNDKKTETTEGESGKKTTEETTEDNKDSEELKKVIIGVGGNEGILMESALIAQKEQFIEEELEKVGYYPEYQAFPGAGPAENEAFATKAIDFAVYGDFPAITAKSNGVDIKVIALSNTTYENGIIAGEGTGIKSIEDLKGKKVVVPLGTVHYKYLEDALNQNGMTVKDVEIVNSVQDGPSMLATGDADAVALTYGGVLLYEKQGVGEVIASSVGEKELSAQFLLAGRTEFMEENEEATVALVKALNRAYEFAKENPDKAYEDLTTESYPSDVIEKVYIDKTFENFSPKIDEEATERFQSTIQYMKDSQLISNDVDINDFIDTSYYEKALQ